MRIDALSALPKRPGFVSLRFDDGSVLRVSLELTADFGLYAGLELPDDRVDALRAAVADGEARRLAASYLSRRPHSRRELIQKLCRREIPPDAAESAAARMAELGYLDDAQYARAVADSCARRGYGRRRVEDELRRRGVAKDDWPDPPDDKDETERAIDTFLHSKLRGQTPDEADRRRLSAALARRGYDWSDIYAALRRLSDDSEQTPD